MNGVRRMYCPVQPISSTANIFQYFSTLNLLGCCLAVRAVDDGVEALALGRRVATLLAPLHGRLKVGLSTCPCVQSLLALLEECNLSRLHTLHEVLGVTSRVEELVDIIGQCACDVTAGVPLGALEPHAGQRVEVRLAVRTKVARLVLLDYFLVAGVEGREVVLGCLSAFFAFLPTFFAVVATLRRVLGGAHPWRSILGMSPERFLMDPKTLATGREMQRETPLSDDDVAFLPQAPRDPIDVGVSGSNPGG